VCQLELRETAANLELQRMEARKFKLEVAIQSFSKFYEFSPVAFVTFNQMARITRANDALASLLKMRRDRLISSPFTTFVEERNLAKYLNHLRECRRASGRTVSTELEMKRWKGDSLPVQLISCRVPSEACPNTFNPQQSW
jgi:PAS domain S-box-containing protein